MLGKARYAVALTSALANHSPSVTRAWCAFLLAVYPFQAQTTSVSQRLRSPGGQPKRRRERERLKKPKLELSKRRFEKLLRRKPELRKRQDSRLRLSDSEQRKHEQKLRGGRRRKPRTKWSL